VGPQRTAGYYGRDIVAALDQAPSATLQALKTLYQCGLIDMNALKTSAFLTPKGYAAADAGSKF